MNQPTAATVERQTTMDPALMSVIANRFDAIVREMSNTLLRSARSGIIAIARDFSCSIVSADDELIASAEGLPNHIFGAHLQTAEMRRRHPDLRDGDAYLDNDPYVGCNHHADHTILVPVFVDGEHLFTAVAKAHQADTGNSQPTTYMVYAQDIYEEGTLNFPCVRIQRDRTDESDIIEMCRRRIRVPEQWYGDYLATLGSARIAERRLHELVAKYGKETISHFIQEWFDYSERSIAHAISKLPSGTYERTGQYDAFPGSDAIPINVKVDVDAEAGRIEIDLRDNIDCIPFGLNLSRVTSTCNAMLGALINVAQDVPHNAGSFRRINVLLRENCVVGYPVHPTSCSVATTNISDRLVNTVQSAFAEAGPEFGIAEGGCSLGPGFAVISGVDARTGSPYVNQLLMGSNGGPATPHGDGWTTWVVPVCAGLLYRDSVEVDEQKYPLLIDSLRLVPDSGGAGRHRGALCVELVYGPRNNPMTLMWMADGQHQPPAGVHGGLSGHRSLAERINADGTVETLPSAGQVILEPGELVRSIDCGGGGFGAPIERAPEAVAHDVAEGWVSREAAEQVYGVVLTEDGTGVDTAATERRRSELAA